MHYIDYHGNCFCNLSNLYGLNMSMVHVCDFSVFFHPPQQKDVNIVIFTCWHHSWYIYNRHIDVAIFPSDAIYVCGPFGWWDRSMIWSWCFQNPDRIQEPGNFRTKPIYIFKKLFWYQNLMSYIPWESIKQKAECQSQCQGDCKGARSISVLNT